MKSHAKTRPWHQATTRTTGSPGISLRIGADQLGIVGAGVGLPRDRRTIWACRVRFRGIGDSLREINLGRRSSHEIVLSKSTGVHQSAIRKLDEPLRRIFSAGGRHVIAIRISGRRCQLRNNGATKRGGKLVRGILRRIITAHATVRGAGCGALPVHSFKSRRVKETGKITGLLDDGIEIGNRGADVGVRRGNREVEGVRGDALGTVGEVHTQCPCPGLGWSS